MWEVFLTCIGHFKNELFFCPLLSPVIGVCRYSIYGISSVIIFPFHDGHGSDAGSIRLVRLLLVLEKALSCCQIIV